MVYAFTKDQHHVSRLTVEEVLSDGVYFAGGQPVEFTRQAVGADSAAAQLEDE
jgi:hypothetical protein